MLIRTLTLTPLAACLFLLSSGLASQVSAADHSAEVVDQPVPKAIAPAIAAKMSGEAVRVTRGSSRTLCDIWLAKEWPLRSLEAGADLLYPFQPGQLIGVIEFKRDSADFRDQEIEAGVYTLRYAQQPVDGAHVGTSLTRDFLLLVPAAADKSTDIMLYTPLTEASAEAAGTSHPALLAMKKVEGDGGVASMRENEEEDWWLVRLGSKAKTEEQTKDLVFDLVVVGIFNE